MTGENTTIGENGRELVGPKSKLLVPHKDQSLIFDLPLAMDSYNKARSKFSDKGLLMPTTAQTFSLLERCLKSRYLEPFRNILTYTFREYASWTSTETMLTPDEVIIYDNANGTMPTNKEALLKLHKEGDKRIRIVPYGFKQGKMSISDFVRNPYVIAQFDGDKDFVKDVVARIVEEFDRGDPYLSVGDAKQAGKRGGTVIETMRHSPSNEDDGRNGLGIITSDNCGLCYASGVEIIQKNAVELSDCLYYF